MISYVITGKKWNQKDIIVDNIFTCNVALNIIKQNEDLEAKSIKECRHRDDWPKWKDRIQAKLNSLSKCEVFHLIVQTLKGVKPMEYK